MSVIAAAASGAAVAVARTAAAAAAGVALLAALAGRVADRSHRRLNRAAAVAVVADRTPIPQALVGLARVCQSRSVRVKRTRYGDGALGAAIPRTPPPTLLPEHAAAGMETVGCAACSGSKFARGYGDRGQPGTLTTGGSEPVRQRRPFPKSRCLVGPRCLPRRGRNRAQQSQRAFRCESCRPNPRLAVPRRLR